jgi:RNA polymerase sigma factor (sigma-70 family)
VATAVSGRAFAVQPVESTAASGEDLFRRHSRRIFAYCRRELGSTAEADDAVQTTFLHALQSIRRGVVPRFEIAWLYTIARRVCIERRRAAARQRELIERCEGEALSDSPVPDADGDFAEIRDALLTLPVRQRRVLLLREWRGLSYQEIAAELDTTVPAVETLLFRARRSLACALRGEQPRRGLRGLDVSTVLGALKTLFSNCSVVKTITAAAVASVALAAAGSTPPPAARTQPETARSGTAAPQLDMPAAVSGKPQPAVRREPDRRAVRAALSRSEADARAARPSPSATHGSDSPTVQERPPHGAPGPRGPGQAEPTASAEPAAPAPTAVNVPTVAAPGLPALPVDLPPVPQAPPLPGPLDEPQLPAAPPLPDVPQPPVPPLPDVPALLP